MCICLLYKRTINNVKNLQNDVRITAKDFGKEPQNESRSIITSLTAHSCFSRHLKPINGSRLLDFVTPDPLRATYPVWLV